MIHTISAFENYISLSVICSIISSISIALIPIEKSSEDNKAIVFIIPIIFWLGFIAEQFFIWRANHFRKVIEKKGERYQKRIRGRPGIISLFKTKEGIASDMLFLVCLIVLIVITVMNVGESRLQYIISTLLVLSFRLHCIFNGINYRYKKLLIEVGK